jgi:hypothetical protein
MDRRRYIQPERKRSVRKYRFGWEYNIKMSVKGTGWTGFFCLRDWWQALGNKLLNLCVL